MKKITKIRIAVERSPKGKLTLFTDPIKWDEDKATLGSKYDCIIIHMKRGKITHFSADVDYFPVKEP